MDPQNAHALHNRAISLDKLQQCEREAQAQAQAPSPGPGLGRSSGGGTAASRSAGGTPNAARWPHAH